MSTYDDWKCTPPEFYDDVDETPCDHEEYDVDWEGRASCNYCNHSWWLTHDELIAYDEAMARWHADYDRQMRRENSRFWRTIDWLKGVPSRIRQQFRRPQPIDDEIPF